MDPFTFIDSMSAKKHLLLVYDDMEFAKQIQFRFINNGLLKEEHCIFLTHSKPKIIEENMEKFGINVNNFKKKKTLRVRQIPNPVDDTDSISEGMNKIVQEALMDSKPPYRIVGRLVPNLQTEEAITIQMYFEQIFHQTMFENFKGSVLCSYDFSEIQYHNRWREWLNRLYTCHNASIIQDKNSQPSVINFN